MAYIDIIDSNGNDFRYALPEDGSVLLIGSGADCSISLPHIADLQPQHCTISLQQEGYVITALSEEASLMAEGQPTQAAVLVPHAVYNLGSTMVMFNDAAVPAPEAPEAQEAQEAPAEPVAEEPVEEEAPKPKKKKVRTGGSAPLTTTAMYTEEDSALHIVIRRLYVILILALAFLAGLTMRYWMITGDFLIDELLK